MRFPRTPRHSYSGECGSALSAPSCGRLYTSARLRTTLIVALSLLFWSGLFVLFHQAFYFVKHQIGGAGDPYHAQTFKLVFHLFFASLNVMLVFSSGIILYGTLFRSPETQAAAHHAGPRRADRPPQVPGGDRPSVAGVSFCWPAP